MSAVLQLSVLWATETIEDVTRVSACPETITESERPETQYTNLAFYRKHTEKMLRRYLYASMLVGRAPSILGEPVGRGWVSSRRVKTFEDAVIFVLDIENCLSKLGSLDQAILSRVVLQEYTQEETATMLGVSVRAISYKYKHALDNLTELLLHADLLIFPTS